MSEEKPKRTLRGDGTLVPPASPAVDRDTLKPPAAVVAPEAKNSKALIGRAVIGIGLASLLGAVAYFVIPKGTTPKMVPPAASAPVEAVGEATNAPVAAAAAEKPVPTAEKMTEIKPAAQSDSAAKLSTAEPLALPQVAYLDAKLRPRPAAIERAGKPDPLFGFDYDGKDGLPTFVCGIRSRASHMALVDMQARKIDVKNGFRLALVPIGFDDSYTLSGDDYLKRTQSGKWDCQLSSVEELSTADVGVVTALLAEDTSDTAIWGRKIDTIYALREKRLGYVKNTNAEFFAQYALALLPAEVRGTIKLTAFDSTSDAVKAFNMNKVDAISATGLELARASIRGGQPLISTKQLRATTDAIVVSRDTIQRDAKLVSAFHRAYFETLKSQIEDPKQSAAAIADWGRLAFTRVSMVNSEQDYLGLLEKSATASLVQNVALMKEQTGLVKLFESARGIVSESGREAVSIPIASQIEPRFVLELGEVASLRTKRLPVDPTFSLIKDEEAGSTPGGKEAELPCRNFTFKPSSSELTDDSKRIIDFCVLPKLQIRDDSGLVIVGSAAWPKGKDYDENTIRQFGRQRAQSVADYLASKGVDIKRLKVDSVVPPQERRDTADELKLSQDRFVEMTILADGW
jgi:hypothetical protein